MDIIDENAARNYLPLDLGARLSCCRRRRESGWPIRKICSYCHVERPSLFRWLNRHDGAEGSLIDGSHRPLSPCPFAIGEGVEYKIRCLFNKSRENGMSSVEIWAKLNSLPGFKASCSTVLRRLKKLDGYEPYTTNPKKRHDKPCHTPADVGEKWRIDVKCVPSECGSPSIRGGRRFCQCTIIGEASRKRFLHWADEHSMYETAEALKGAVAFFGYSPRLLQRDWIMIQALSLPAAFFHAKSIGMAGLLTDS